MVYQRILFKKWQFRILTFRRLHCVSEASSVNGKFVINVSRFQKVRHFSTIFISLIKRSICFNLTTSLVEFCYQFLYRVVRQFVSEASKQLTEISLFVVKLRKKNFKPENKKNSVSHFKFRT